MNTTVKFMCSALVLAAAAARAESFDVVVYGATPAGITAVVQAKRMGKKVVLLEPTDRIGGMTTGGLGHTDSGNQSAFGGLARRFYEDVARHYADDRAWTRQRRSDYEYFGQSADDGRADTMWSFEPSAALDILNGWEKREGLDVRRRERLDRAPGRTVVDEQTGKIVSLTTESGKVYSGKVFIDATYEGDLMAAAGVTYVVGRESNAKYGEHINGVQRALATKHQFVDGVSAYVKEGDPSSGLLPGVELDVPLADGDGDDRVQAYCFRMCLTDVPENRIPFRRPDGYRELDYELLIRNLQKSYALGLTNDWAQGLPWINAQMPNRKTDTNNRLGFSTDFIGQNHRYPEASYAERSAIEASHLRYQQGLMWTLANHPRVPEFYRREVSRWGTCRDEFVGERGDGWQNQIYVRESRRMVGSYVMTEHNCRGIRKAPHPIAMGAYMMDSHHVRRYVDSRGFVRNEGDVQVGAAFGGERFAPYPIDYGALVPKRGECPNLIVPVCVSASHVAFGSIRMEPVFFALGQAAGTAAALAIDDGEAVQDVDYARLRARLLRDGQVL